MYVNRIIYSSLIPFPTINNILILIKRFNFTLVFLKAAFHASPAAIIKRVPQFNLFYDMFQKFSKTSANNIVML